MVCWIYGLVLSGKRKNMAQKAWCQILILPTGHFYIVKYPVSAATLADFK